MDRGNELAEVLGMSQEEFQTALEEGHKQVLVDIVEGQGMTLEEVAQALYDKAAERLESAVADGKLTQEQADHILEKVTERRDACINDGDCMMTR
jgi:predicted DsbA family dithiol-disulfide isomerase